jgi:hypothetical protein
MTYPIIVHGLDDARAAAAVVRALGVPLTLVSAPEAGGYAGAGWFNALVKAVRAAHPDLDITAVLDCGAEPGRVLAALRTGTRHVRFTGDAVIADKLRAIAQAQDATLWTGPLEAFDPRPCRDRHKALQDWLAGAGRTLDDARAVAAHGSGCMVVPPDWVSLPRDEALTLLDGLVRILQGKGGQGKGEQGEDGQGGGDEAGSGPPPRGGA